ncbi:MAG: hypothetical protein IIT65_11340, partial [Lachnospiraceae bacterium]|nr:hypothetical protein [Lachnospiraceae bacterium]
VDYNLNNIRYYFLDNYPKTIHLFLIGSWYKIYNDEAEIISYIFNYKLFDVLYKPEIDSLTLYEYITNYSMFEKTLLSITPKLSATTLTKGCYSYMFRECT